MLSSIHNLKEASWEGGRDDLDRWFFLHFLDKDEITGQVGKKLSRMDLSIDSLDLWFWNHVVDREWMPLM